MRNKRTENNFVSKHKWKKLLTECSEAWYYKFTISQLLKLRFTAMVTYSFHLYSRSSHDFIQKKNRRKLGILNQNLVKVSRHRLSDRAFLVPNESAERKLNTFFTNKKCLFHFMEDVFTVAARFNHGMKSNNDGGFRKLCYDYIRHVVEWSWVRLFGCIWKTRCSLPEAHLRRPCRYLSINNQLILLVKVIPQ